MAIGATSSEGTKGVVVAAHTLTKLINGTFVDHSVGKRQQTIEDLAVMSTIFGEPYEQDNVDAAFIPITESGIAISDSQVRTNNGTVFDVTQGRLRDMTVFRS